MLLQGPLGPFFTRFAQMLRQHDREVYKINFNGGDLFFSGAARISNFDQCHLQWAHYLDVYLEKHKISDCFVYGDCRYYHKVARAVCERHNVRFWVFEEGYLRPDFITLEQGGANANSQVDFSPARLARYREEEPETELIIGQTLRYRVVNSCLYYGVKALCSSEFKRYRHHRLGTWLSEAQSWLRSGWRKISRNRNHVELLERLAGKQMYLLPLQVYNDMQIRHHSDYMSMEHVLTHVVDSFARHADAESVLVVKHHPMDRGFKDYTWLIEYLRNEYKLGERLVYCHDLNLPSLLRMATGCVTLNSTVGLSSLLHGTPTKLLGRAFYNIPGITSQQELSDFWQNPARVNRRLERSLHALIRNETQVNGSFYKHHQQTCANLAAFLKLEQGRETARANTSWNDWRGRPNPTVD